MGAPEGQPPLAAISSLQGSSSDNTAPAGAASTNTKRAARIRPRIDNPQATRLQRLGGEGGGENRQPR
jgi:hypothetical protein